MKNKELTYEYKMPYELAETLLPKNLKKKKRSKILTAPAQEFLCDYVNSQKTLRGTCTKVILF